MPWTNNDGLVVRFGTEEAKHGNRGGSVSEDFRFIMEVEIVATELTLSPSVINESILTVPKGMRIEKVEVLVETAFTSAGAATLSLGYLNLNRTAFGSNALINGIPVANLTAGAALTLTVGSANVGSSVGAVNANPYLLSQTANTAVFTAGRALVRVYGYMPL